MIFDFLINWKCLYPPIFGLDALTKHWCASEIFSLRPYKLVFRVVLLLVVCIDLRKAELVAAMEHDRVKAAAKAAADAPQRNPPRIVAADGRAAPTISGTRASKSGPNAPTTRSLTRWQAQKRWWRKTSD
jgi:hypothetical protein